MKKLETAEERDRREAEVIDGQVSVRLSDERDVVVREFGWRQARRLHPVIHPVAKAVAAKAVDGDLPVQAIFEMVTDHPDEFDELLKAATGLTDEDLDGLSESDGEALTVAFFRLHTPFFAKRVVREMIAEDRLATDESSAPSDPENSSPPSSGSGMSL